MTPLQFTPSRHGQVSGLDALQFAAGRNCQVLGLPNTRYRRHCRHNAHAARSLHELDPVTGEWRRV